jgi:ATP-binding cassette subfamily C protein
MITDLLKGVVLSGSTKQIIIDDPSVCYLILSGGADVFFANRLEGNKTGARHHVVHKLPTELIMGISVRSEFDSLFCLTPLPNSKILQFDRQNLLQLLESRLPEAQQLISQWFSSVVDNSIYLSKDLSNCKLLRSGDINFTADSKIGNNTDDCFVIRVLQGSCAYLNQFTLVEGDAAIIRPGAWFQALGDAKVECASLAEAIERRLDVQQIEALNAFLEGLVELSYRHKLAIEHKRLEKQHKSHQSQLGSALKLLASIFSKDIRPRYVSTESSVILACRVITNNEGIPFTTPTAKSDGGELTLRDIEYQSVFRSREVLLRGSWWKQDHGSLLAFNEGDGSAVALIPDGPKKYLAYDRELNDYLAVDEQYAKTLKPQAFFFYRPFEDKAIDLRGLMKFGMRNSKRDMWVTLFVSLLAALLGMCTPVAMSILIDNVIPEANRNQLFFLGIGLLAIAIGDATFSITRGVSMQRFQGKNGMAIQTAVWDRLLALPVPFFQSYSAGELSNRANGISTIMSILGGTTSTALISGVFSILYFGLLFYYNSSLALIAVGIAVVTIIATVVVNLIKLSYIRKETTLTNEMAGLVLQLLEGVSKLRNTGAEARAFTRWSILFSKLRPQVYKAENVSNYLETYNAILPLISSILIFWAVIYYTGQGDAAMSTGVFIGFNVAYASFLGGMLGLTEAAMSIMAIIPIYENSKPVLQAIPERLAGKEQARDLDGKIEVNNIRFRYDEDGPDILKGVSLQIKKGEYIALVGGSGSGKSTLLRVLLGFETPSVGSVFYDDVDLNTLDVTSLRRQLGVVLQNGSLMLGDIYKNIVGSAPLTVDDAWEAASMCGLKQDIEAMPMGMNTMISSGVLSGGQMQRLMIARAIVHKPKILYFDEATSALDNRTQAVVTKSLEQLSVTRIVIAHRLSTIINADRILYLHEGEIMEDGTYDELIARNGYFAEMAKRQTL